STRTPSPPAAAAPRSPARLRAPGLDSAPPCRRRIRFPVAAGETPPAAARREPLARLPILRGAFRACYHPSAGSRTLALDHRTARTGMAHKKTFLSGQRIYPDPITKGIAVD